MEPRRSAKLRAALAVVAAGALLAACGGGGGEPAPVVVVPQTTRAVAASSGSDVTAQKLPTLGGWLARAVLSASGDGAFGLAGARESPQGRRTANAGAPTPWLARAANAALHLAALPAAVRERPAAASSQTKPCLNPGGSVTLTFNDADDSQKLSAGDSVALVASSCVLDAGLPAASGTLLLVIHAVELDASDLPTALDASATVTSFSVGGYGTYSGSMRLWTRPEGARERARVSFMGTSVTYGAGTVVFDFDIYALADSLGGTFDINGGIGIDGQTYSIVTGEILSSTGLSPPVSGSVRLRDAAGDVARLTARGVELFDLDFLPAGASLPTGSLPGLSWADYLAPPP